MLPDARHFVEEEFWLTGNCGLPAFLRELFELDGNRLVPG